MREIGKFRGMRVDTGEWVKGALLETFDLTFILTAHNGECGVDYLDDIQGYTYDVIPSTVGEYTGLHDKNGKEICEGDIVKVADGKTAEIYYDSKVAAFLLGYTEPKGTCNFFVDYFRANAMDFEVIGTIHDEGGAEEMLTREQLEDKKILTNDYFKALQLQDGGMGFGMQAKALQLANEVIETALALLDRVEKAEAARDAAVKDLRDHADRPCHVCKDWANGRCVRPTRDCAGFWGWQWRGMKGVNERESNN